jgi:signal transduction histidine kinase
VPTATQTSTAMVRQRPSARREALAYYFAVSLLGFALLTWSAVAHTKMIASHLLLLVPWAILLIVVHLLPVSGWPSAHLAFDLPVAVGAAMVLSPVETMLLGFLCSFDSLEIRGQITLTKALFNRVQTALCYGAASAVAHSITSSPESSPFVVPLAFLALCTQVLVNYVLVGAGLAIEHVSRLAHVVRHLRLGSPVDFWLSLVSSAVLGAMLAALYDQVHPLTLLAFLGPALLGRQALEKSQLFLEESQVSHSRERTIAQISQQIFEERSDERQLIAADLHDEVLQPLFRVSLLAHVLKAELANGKLLDMDQDLPELSNAAEVASNSIRDLIGDLRRSAVGRGGLAPAVWSLVRNLRGQTSAEIHAHVAPVQADATTELAIYQIGKEALTNAVTHSRARNVWVELRQDSSGLYLSVRDDGVGFDPLASKQSHYGLQIMRERATSAGGDLWLDSTPKHGCQVTLGIPCAERQSPQGS